jgi:hypothetical protein
MAHDSWPFQDNTLNYVRKITTPLGTTPTTSRATILGGGFSNRMFREL